MAPVMPVVVAEPQAQRPLHGLLDAMPQPVASGEEWLFGYGYLPQTIPAPSIWLPASTDEDREKAAPQGPGTPVFIDPFMVVLATRQSTWGGSWPEWRRNVRTMLDLSLSYALERELWTGTDALTTGGLVQSTPTIIGSAAVAPTVGMALLSEALGDSDGGALGMIHAPAPVGEMLAVQALQPSGNRFVTKGRGDYVIIGSGYDGTTGPTGEVAVTGTVRWLFASSMISLRLGPAEIVPGTEAQALDRRTNDVELRAEQIAAFTPLNPDRTFAVRVDLAL